MYHIDIHVHVYEIKVPRRALCTLWWPKLANNSENRLNSIKYLQTTIAKYVSQPVNVPFLLKNGVK